MTAEAVFSDQDKDEVGKLTIGAVLYLIDGSRGGSLLLTTNKVRRLIWKKNGVEASPKKVAMVLAELAEENGWREKQVGRGKRTRYIVQLRR